MGEDGAAVGPALADHTHPAGARVLQRDPRHAERVIETRLPLEPDAGVRGVVRTAAATVLGPATEETAAGGERLLELGVVSQPTGDHPDDLEVEPPLCVTRASVDAFTDALGRVLTTGW